MEVSMRGRRVVPVLVVLALIAASCGSGSSTTESGAATSTTASSQPISTTTGRSIPSSTSSSTSTSTVAESAPTTMPQPAEERFSVSALFEPLPGVAISNGPEGAWDWQYTDPGAAVSIDGTIHAFQNGFVGWPSPVGVGYWTSEDGGRTWTEVSDEPVFDGTDLPYVGVAALASSVLQKDDGSWALYFYSWDQGTWPVSTGSIGRATAPEPTGPWTADPEPVLVAGSEGEWDELAVRSPSVLEVDDGYVMYFAGTTRDKAMIGMATSPDGVAWTKYDDPTTIEAPFAESDPVLTPGVLDGGGNWWDLRNVYIPNVVHTDDGFVMLYSASSTVTDPTTLTRKVGFAVSEDGLAWNRSKTGALSATAFPNGQIIYFSELVADDDGYLILLEIGIGNETEVYAARHDGPIPAP